MKLSDALDLRVGAGGALKAYRGSELVWEPAPSGPTLYSYDNFADTYDNLDGVPLLSGELWVEMALGKYLTKDAARQRAIAYYASATGMNGSFWTPAAPAYQGNGYLEFRADSTTADLAAETLRGEFRRQDALNNWLIQSGNGAVLTVGYFQGGGFNLLGNIFVDHYKTDRVGIGFFDTSVQAYINRVPVGLPMVGPEFLLTERGCGLTVYHTTGTTTGGIGELRLYSGVPA